MAKVGLLPLQLNFCLDDDCDDYDVSIQNDDSDCDFGLYEDVQTPTSTASTTSSVDLCDTALTDREFSVYNVVCDELMRLQRMTPSTDLDIPVQLLPHVFLGDSSAAMDVALLEALEINSVFNCASRAVLTNESFYGDSWNYLSVPAEDFPEYDILDHFNMFASFLDHCRDTKRKVLVHCVAGVNRSPALCVAYLMKSQNMGILSAVRLCASKRPIVLKNDSFVRQLVRFASKHNLLF